MLVELDQSKKQKNTTYKLTSLEHVFMPCHEQGIKGSQLGEEHLCGTTNVAHSNVDKLDDCENMKLIDSCNDNALNPNSHPDHFWSPPGCEDNSGGIDSSTQSLEKLVSMHQMSTSTHSCTPERVSSPIMNSTSQSGWLMESSTSINKLELSSDRNNSERLPKSQLERAIGEILQLNANERTLEAHRKYLDVLRIASNFLENSFAKPLAVIRKRDVGRQLQGVSAAHRPELQWPHLSKFLADLDNVSRIPYASMYQGGDGMVGRDDQFLIYKKEELNKLNAHPELLYVPRDTELEKLSLSSADAQILLDLPSVCPLPSTSESKTETAKSQAVFTDNLQAVLDRIDKAQNKSCLDKVVWDLKMLPCISYAEQESRLAQSETFEEKRLGFQQASLRSMPELALPCLIEVIFVDSEDSVIIKDSKQHNFRIRNNNLAENAMNTSNQISPMLSKLATSANQKTIEDLRWLKIYFEFIVNNPYIHLLRTKFHEMQLSVSLLRLCKDEKVDCNEQKTTLGKVRWKQLSANDGLVLIEGILPANMFECLSLVRESDLHSCWFPFLHECCQIYHLSPFVQVVTQRYRVPILGIERGTLIMAHAVDCLELDDSIIISAFSIMPSAKSIFGNRLPDSKSTTQMTVKCLCWRFSSEDSNSTKMELAAWLDPRVNYIPPKLEALTLCFLITRLFRNIHRYCKSFKTSQHEKRIQEHSILYNDIAERLRLHRIAKSNE